MEKLYVRAQYLKIAHYFFYSMAVFSVTTAFALWETFLFESVGLLIFSIIYLNATLWLAYFFYSDYKLQLKDVRLITRYAKPYVILSITVFVMTELFVLIIPEISGLIFSILFINFYYAFIIIIGAAMYLIKPVRTIFNFQMTRALKNGKEIAMEHSSLEEVANYRIGTDPFMDDILEDIWNNRDFPVPNVQRLEIEACQKKINEIQGRMELAKKLNWSQNLTAHLEREKKRYEKKIEDTMNYNY